MSLTAHSPPQSTILLVSSSEGGVQEGGVQVFHGVVQ